MIWHFLEVWALLLGGFVVGGTMGAVLHQLLAQSRFATAQGALADSIGDVVDRVKDRFGVGAVWRPEPGRILDRSDAENRYDDIGLGEARADPRDADDGLIRDWEDDPEDRGPIDSDVEADWLDQAEPVLEQDHAEPIRELHEMEPFGASDAADGTAPPTGEPVSAPVPDDGVLPKRPASLAEPRNGVPDNLQRIRGIGERNEARLNQLGIFHFGQIASWTPAEMHWVSQQLAFPERIERDAWIGQAIVLASGGDTGFTKSAERRRARRQREPRLPDEAITDATDDEARGA